MKQGVEVVEHPVSAHVTLGDSETTKQISKAVSVKVKFASPSNKVYEADLYCYVLPAPDATQLIIGVPGILCTNLYFLFLEILQEGYQVMGHSLTGAMVRAAQHINELTEVKELLVPWPMFKDPLSPEELDTVVPDSFTDSLNFLSGTREEAEKKYEEDVRKYVDGASVKYCEDHGKESMISFLLSDQIKQTFLPKKWEGFKNVQLCGANENDEFELEWDEENFPVSLDAKLRPTPVRLAQVVSLELDRLGNYLWTDSDSPVCCPLTVAPKATTPFVRVAGDYRPVNPFLRSPKEYIPDVQKEIIKMQQFTVFADIDQTNSFHQIRLTERSSRRLTVKTPLGLKRPMFVPEGISPGSALLQRVNRTIFADMLDHMVVMFDNLLVGGKDYDDLQQKLEKFFERCRKHNIICKMAKSRFGQDSVNFFGYVVRNGGYELSEERKAAVNEIPMPTNLNKMQRFLGTALFFKPFIENYSSLTAPLNDMTKGNFSWDKQTWKVDYEQVFESVKASLLKSMKLNFPDYNKQFILRTDASKLAVGGVLLQKSEDGELQPIAFVSCKLSDTAQRWDAYKLECFGVYYAVKQLNYYLTGKEFIIETDHQNLQWLDKNDSAIVMRWRWYLQNFNILIRHIPGKQNIVADFLSRMYPDDKPLDEESSLDTSHITHDQITHLYSLYELELPKVVSTIKVHLEHHRLRTTYEMKSIHSMSLAIGDFIKQYVMLHTIPYDGFRFTINGTKIKSTDTPASLGLVDGDIITVTGETYAPEIYDNTASPILCLARHTGTSKAKHTRPIQYVDHISGRVVHHVAVLDINSDTSEIPFDFYTKHLRSFATHAKGKHKRNHVMLPIRIECPSSGTLVEVRVEFTVVNNNSPTTIGYKHITKILRESIKQLFTPMETDSIDIPYKDLTKPIKLSSKLKTMLEKITPTTTSFMETVYHPTGPTSYHFKGYTLVRSSGIFTLTSDGYSSTSDAIEILTNLRIDSTSTNIQHQDLDNILRSEGIIPVQTRTVQRYIFDLEIPISQKFLHHVRVDKGNLTYSTQFMLDDISSYDVASGLKSTCKSTLLKIPDTCSMDPALAVHDILSQIDTSIISRPLKITPDSIAVPKGTDNTSRAVSFNPVHLFGTDPQRASSIPHHVLNMISKAIRPAYVLPAESEHQTRDLQRVYDVKFDSGMSPIMSTVGLNLVNQFPELFRPTYYPSPKCYGVAINGTPVHSVGECSVLLRFQHDITGQLHESIIPLRIIQNKDRDHIVLSYYASCRYFYPVFTQAHRTYRAVILNEFERMFGHIIQTPVTKILTRQRTFNSDGTVLPTTTTLSHIQQGTSPILLCHECHIPQEHLDAVTLLNPLQFLHSILQEHQQERHSLNSIPSHKVQTKFMPSDNLLSTLSNTSSPTLSTFISEYFDDSRQSLTCSDLWLCKRDDTFTLKYPHPHGHTGGISHYLESTDVATILQKLKLPAATQHPLPQDTLTLHGIHPFAKVFTNRQTYANIMVPSSRHPTQNHICHIHIDKAIFFCNDSTSEYHVATVDLDKHAILDTPQAAMTDTIAHLNIQPDCIINRLHSKIFECISRHSPAHFNKIIKIISAKITPTPKARKTEEDQGESMLLSDDPEENLKLWMQQLHGGFNLHMGARRAYTKASQLFPGHQLPFQFFQDYVNSCATCQKQRQRMALAFQALVKTLKMPLVPRAVVGIDTLALPQDMYGNQYVHIIVSMFSKLAFGYVSKDNTAESVCDALITYFATHGLHDIQRIDPGSNLVAEAVKLLNAQFGITQKISMVDVHTSNGVENAGVKKIINHLQALCSDFRIKDKWSEPKYIQYCFYMINSIYNQEVGDIPFKLHWGDYEKLNEKYLQPIEFNPETRSKYIKELHEMQKIANEASAKYQKELHEASTAKTNPISKNKYQPGDFVLKLRDLPLNMNKLQNLKYKGPYEVIRHIDNAVTCKHCSTNIEETISVDRLVIFDSSRESPFKVAQLDNDEFLVISILAHKGDPMKRSQMKFLVHFEDDDEPIWINYSKDLSINTTFINYCQSIPCLKHLNLNAKEAEKSLNKITKTPIDPTLLNKTIYLDLRIYSDSWFESRNLPESFTKKYVVEAKYTKLNKKDNIIDIHVPIFPDTIKFNNLIIQWYGLDFDFDKKNMILIDENLIKKYPQIAQQ